MINSPAQDEAGDHRRVRRPCSCFLSPLSLVIAFFIRDPRGEHAWHRIIAPAMSTALLTGIVILAVRNYGAVALLGLGSWLVLRLRRPLVYAAIGLDSAAVTARLSA